MLVDASDLGRGGRGLAQGAGHLFPIGAGLGQQLERTPSVLEHVVAYLSDRLGQGRKEQRLAA